MCLRIRIIHTTVYCEIHIHNFMSAVSGPVQPRAPFKTDREESGKPKTPYALIPPLRI